MIAFLVFNNSNSQNKYAFKSGEWLNYKISYSGWFKAGEATVNLTQNNQDQFHAKMIGKSTEKVVTPATRGHLSLIHI